MSEPFNAHIHAASDGNGNGTVLWIDLLCPACHDDPCHCDDDIHDDEARSYS